MTHASPDAEGIWPPLAVRDLLERVKSEALEHAMEIGLYNERGWTTRSLDEGGDQERDLVGKYQAWAEKTRMSWPRTAAILERIAETYKRQAEAEDLEAERWQDI